MESDLIALHSSNYRREAEVVTRALEIERHSRGGFLRRWAASKKQVCNLSAGAKLIVNQQDEARAKRILKVT